MKRSPLATVRRTARRAATWRPKSAGDRALDILALASPLRYDIVVRGEFFAWLGDHSTDRSDPELIEGARALPYRVWFTEVAMARFRPWVLRDPATLEEQFAERVRTARRLAESMAERGFDLDSPVTLRLTKGEMVADSGAHTSASLHVGDGGHRLALLLASGGVLEPYMYRVDPRPMPLLDNTAILARSLGLTDAAYARFVSRGFLPEPAADILSMRRAVARTAPERLPELDSVLLAHGRTGTSSPGALPETKEPLS